MQPSPCILAPVRPIHCTKPMCAAAHGAVHPLTRRRIRQMGSNILKFSLAKRYSNIYIGLNVAGEVDSLKGLALQPDFAQARERPKQWDGDAA